MRRQADTRTRRSRAIAPLLLAGSLDVEIFSTPDGFWSLTADEAARRAYAAVVALADPVGSDT